MPKFIILLKRRSGMTREADYERAFATISQAEVLEQIVEDEEHLFDRSSIRAYFVDERASPLPVV